MSFPLKPISLDAIPAALEKVHRYRGLNEPAEAESICLDILEADPHNQEATTLLLLSRTDQIEDGRNPQDARQILPSLESEYDRAYYAGIILERTAKALMKQGAPGSSYTAYEKLHEAMEWFEKAQALRPPGHDDAILRWNACARLLMRHPELRPRPKEAFAPVMSE
jgi:tetratricopeptide (TPR) repeat protein